MPSFNADIDVADLQVTYTEGDPAARLIQVVGFDIPLPTPQGIVGAKIGLGTVSSILDRESLTKLVEQATEALANFPEEEKQSDLVIANSMSQAKGFADQLEAATHVKG